MKRVLPVLLLLAACASPAMPPARTQAPEAVSAPPPPPGPTVENAAERHREIQWFRTAAEYRALALQTYHAAWAAVQDRAADLEPGSWVVVLDGDETVIDNSDFERRITETDIPFEEHLWDEWVFEEDAGLIPGAGDFIARVQGAGGRVAIVTNRDQRLCPATARNLAELGVHPDALLCERETGEKEPRFEMLREGTAVDSLPPLTIVAWVGDNIRDFPDLTQDARTGPADAFRLFGEVYFMMPNPMYGSWMGNAWR